jgi:hypothetical protein
LHPTKRSKGYFTYSCQENWPATNKQVPHFIEASCIGSNLSRVIPNLCLFSFIIFSHLIFQNIILNIKGKYTNANAHQDLTLPLKWHHLQTSLPRENSPANKTYEKLQTWETKGDE